MNTLTLSTTANYFVKTDLSMQDTNFSNHKSSKWISNDSYVDSNDISEDVPINITDLIVYIFIGVVGMISNFFVIFVISKSKKMKAKFTNIMILHQSIIDFLSSFLLVITAHINLNEDGLVGHWDDIYCKVWMSKLILWTLMLISTYNLVMVTFERYLEIVFPLRYKVFFSKIHQIVFLLLPWVVGIGSEFPCALLTHGLVDGNCVFFALFPNYVSKLMCTSLKSTITFFLPLIIIISTNTRIFWALRKATHAFSGENDSNDRRAQAMRAAQSNIIKTMFLVCTCFFVCWVANQTMLSLYVLGVVNISIFYGPFFGITMYAVFCNCFINPFVYMLKYDQFQEAAKQLLCKNYRNNSKYASSAENSNVGNTNSVQSLELSQNCT